MRTSTWKAKQVLASGCAGLILACAVTLLQGCDSSGGGSGSGGVIGAGGITGVTPLYMAIGPVDAGTSGPEVGLVTKYMGPMPTDAGPTVKYMAVMPDAGQKDLGGAVAVYSAPVLPDAGLPMRYSAPQPKQDAGIGVMPLYMAPMPTKN